MPSIEIEMKEIYKVICRSFEHNQDIILKVRGTSMFPLMKDRVDSFRLAKITRPLKRLDIVLYIRPNGDFVLHRIIKIKKDYCLITGDHQYVLEKVKYEQIKGIVTQIIKVKKKKEKIITCNKGIGYNTYLLVWCTSLFARKVMIKFIHLMGKIKRKLRRKPS